MIMASKKELVPCGRTVPKLIEARNRSRIPLDDPARGRRIFAIHRVARASVVASVAVGTLVPSAPRSDPYVRSYRIRLLP